MNPQVPFVHGDNAKHGISPPAAPQQPQYMVVVIQPPYAAAPQNPPVMGTTQMYGGHDAGAWIPAQSFAVPIAQSSCASAAEVALWHTPLAAPPATQQNFTLAPCPPTPASWYEVDHAFADGTSQQIHFDQSAVMHAPCCEPQLAIPGVGGEPVFETTAACGGAVCSDAAHVDDFISTASESERIQSIYSMRERRYSTDTEHTHGGSLSRFALHEESSGTATVTLNDLISCTSSVSDASSNRRRRRRRGGRGGGAGAPAPPPHAADAAAGTASAARPVAKSEPTAKKLTDIEPMPLSAEDGQKLMDQLSAGGMAGHTAIATIQCTLVVLAFDAVGCRIVQKAFEVADAAEREMLVSTMHGHVQEAMRSPHANFVIQKIVEVLPVMLASFVAEELTGIAAEVARHRYGCRILCRLLEHHSDAKCTATKTLFDEVLADAGHLCHHSFARHVIESVLEHGSAEQRTKVALAINGDLLHNARNRNASYVVEKAFTFCNIEDQRLLATTLLRNGADRIVALAMHDCGNHVLKAMLLSQCAEQAETVKQIMRAESASIQLSKYGKRILEEI